MMVKTFHNVHLCQAVRNNKNANSGWIAKVLAADFLAYLADKESEEATQELVNIPGFIESFERGKKDIAEERVVNWRNSRSDV